MVFQLLICLNLIAPRLVKADFAVASQDPKGGKPNTSWRPTTTAEITRFVGINGATDRWNQWTSHKKKGLRCRDIDPQRFGCQDLFCPAESTNVKEQKGQRQTLRRVLKFAVWLLRNTAQKPSRKQRICNNCKGIDHTCRCLLFAGSAHCIPLPLKIWRRSKIWQQKLCKPRFRASTETTKLLNMSNNVTCHHNSHLSQKIHNYT